MNQKVQLTGCDASSLSDKALMGTTREITATDGHKIQWVEFGCGQPIVVSPALGTPLASWFPAISALQEDFKLVFVLPRGGCEGPTTQDPGALTVERRAEDLAELINSLGFQEYFIIAHSSGVAPVVVSLNQLHMPPSHVCLISARYCEGQPVGAEELLERARGNTGFMNVVQSIVVGYSPPSVAGVMREYLRDFGRLEALLYSFEQSRAFRYVEPWCAGIAMTFVMAEHDPEDVRQSTQEIIDTHSKEPWALVDVPGAGHFFVQDDGAAAAALIARSLSQA